MTAVFKHSGFLLFMFEQSYTLMCGNKIRNVCVAHKVTQLTVGSSLHGCPLCLYSKHPYNTHFATCFILTIGLMFFSLCNLYIEKCRKIIVWKVDLHSLLWYYRICLCVCTHIRAPILLNCFC